jgi:hypothetical protein
LVQFSANDEFIIYSSQVKIQKKKEKKKKKLIDAKTKFLIIFNIQTKQKKKASVCLAYLFKKRSIQ